MAQGLLKFFDCRIVGSVAEWSMAADCKSAGVMPTVVQIHPGPQKFSGSSSVGRASAFQAEGRGFESRLPLNCLHSSGGRALPW
jgi:hypothetical protein